MSEDCKGRRISIGPCDIRNSHKITADGVLQNVLECEICGRREVQTFDELYKKEFLKISLITYIDIYLSKNAIQIANSVAVKQRSDFQFIRNFNYK